VHAGSAQDDTSILLSFRDAQTKVTDLGYGNIRLHSMCFSIGTACHPPCACALALLCPLHNSIVRCSSTLRVCVPAAVAVLVFTLSHLQASASNQSSPILSTWTGPACDNNTFSRWSDVYCSGGRVAELRLGGLGLVGPLPAAWANLTALQRLYLRSVRLAPPGLPAPGAGRLHAGALRVVPRAPQLQPRPHCPCCWCMSHAPCMLTM